VSSLTRLQVAGYGALGLPLAFAALPVYVYAPKFYAGLGLSLAASGAVLLAARLADAVIDPWLGAWSDRVANRKRFIALFLVPLGIGMFALFHPPAAGTGWLTLWLAAFLALVYLGFSAANIAYQAWGARIAGTAHERTVVSAAREGLGLGGVVLASLLPQLLAPRLATGDAASIEAGLPQTSIAFIAILLVCAAITLLLAPARRVEDKSLFAPEEKLIETSSGSHSPAGVLGGLLGGLRGTLASPRYRRLLWVFGLNGIASAIPATLFLFFAADVLQASGNSGGFLALYFVAAACALPLWVRAAQRFGKRPAWLASMLLAIAAFAWAWLLGPGDTTAFAAICIASGIALGADLALPPSILADVIEHDQSSGREGAYFGVWNLVTKLNLALAAGLSLPALAWAGYVPSAGSNAANGGYALSALAIAYCLVPCALKLCAAAMLYRSDFHR
jgi:glycoside/pentoside/hexuronide:cation symporter, GPH family